MAPQWIILRTFSRSIDDFLTRENIAKGRPIHLVVIVSEFSVSWHCKGLIEHALS